MRIALGIYTEISTSSPLQAFSRAAELVYKPVLSYMYNNPGSKLSLYQSAAMIKYLASVSPEVNMLIALLSKRGDLELVTGTYSQAILSLNPPKDRSLQIEKMTTLIRRYYGVRASCCFFYGQIWAPSFIHSLRNTGISSVVISSYKATSRDLVDTSSFVMNELGKKVGVKVISDRAAQLVSRYAQGEVTLASMLSSFQLFASEEGEDEIIFINLDQILEGSARAGDDDSIAAFIPSLMEGLDSSSLLLSSVNAEKPGYLDSGWYGRDAYAQGLHSFNDIFVRNENFRYLLNRYIALSEIVAGFKKDKAVRRDAESELFHISIGPLFIHDAECTPMRLQERRLFWKAIIECERIIEEADAAALRGEYDFEEIGENDYIARNKIFTVVFSPKGGAVAELCYKPLAINILDTRVPFDKSFPHVFFNKSFSDRVRTADGEISLNRELFDSEVLSRNRGEYQFSYSTERFSVIKHFKLRSQTLVMETTILPEVDMDGEYVIDVFTSLSDMVLGSFDQRKQMMVGSLEDVRTVKYTEPQSGLNLSFSSIEPFSVTEERVRQTQNTSIGIESFELYTRLSFSFKLSQIANEAKTYRFILRLSDSRKDRE
ncbi:MAG: hypothetical protein IAA97_04305 [Spirochaetes bacterium]|uniref:Glycoside hydrolase family 57 N-terminal domain-containing protein n=1 Tax=Candidatus Ornithospirochaeta stercoripullorum TaxID=2840899 RepID=A0A9D9E1J1_9SPIO|nr:hypothetical protein [Candidatus Ornithospirochaeta stercoripullorum]